MPGIHDTYCEIEFLEQFFMRDLNQLEDEDLVFELRRLIMGNSNLILNGSREEVKGRAAINPHFKKLLKRSTSGGSELIEMSREQFDIQVLDEEALCRLQPRSLLLHNLETERSDVIRSSTQLLNSNSDDCLEKLSELFRNSDYKLHPEVHLNSFPGWDALNQTELPVSEVIIADRYLLSESTGFGNNLFKILESLLPKTLEQDLNIALFAARDRAINMRRAYEIVTAFLDSKSLPYCCNLEIYYFNLKETHDRNVFTNYFWINSGHSFDYVNNKNRVKDSRNAQISFRALGAQSDLSNTLLTEFREISARCRKGVLGVDWMGELRNRLLG